MKIFILRQPFFGGGKYPDLSYAAKARLMGHMFLMVYTFLTGYTFY